MIARLKGLLDSTSADACVVDVNGVGYLVSASVRTLERLGATVIEGAAIVDLPELGGSARLREAGLPLFTLVDFAGH